MPPRGIRKGSKRERQYEHIKESEKDRGEPRAEEIAARAVNKQRAESGETKRAAGRGRNEHTKADLYREAKRLDVAGRSRMSKGELQRAIAAKRG